MAGGKLNVHLLLALKNQCLATAAQIDALIKCVSDTDVETKGCPNPKCQEGPELLIEMRDDGLMECKKCGTTFKGGKDAREEAGRKEQEHKDGEGDGSSV